MNRDRDFLLDIVELIDTIERHRPETEEEFLEGEVLLTATVHWVQTIGEAANAVSRSLRAQYPQVPWRQIVEYAESPCTRVPPRRPKDGVAGGGT